MAKKKVSGLEKADAIFINLMEDFKQAGIGLTRDQKRLIQLQIRVAYVYGYNDGKGVK